MASRLGQLNVQLPPSMTTLLASHLAHPTEGAGAKALGSTHWAAPEQFPSSLENLLFMDKNFNLWILRMV